MRVTHSGRPLPLLLPSLGWLIFVSRPATQLPGHIHEEVQTFKSLISGVNEIGTNNSPMLASLAGREALYSFWEGPQQACGQYSSEDRPKATGSPSSAGFWESSATTFIPLSEPLTEIVCGLVGLNGSHTAHPVHYMSNNFTPHSLFQRMRTALNSSLMQWVTPVKG